MSQGNPNKVIAIVDEIVKDNNMFKLKSPIEQTNEKASMAKSINSALSVLNETGRELVLQDLSVDPDEKFKGLIDNAGNIDISGLTQITTILVKEKIEEAAQKGIDLRRDSSTVFKDSNKVLITEGILTVALIDTMIKNYNNLSNEDRNSLLDHYHEMSDEQRANINKQIDDRAFKLQEQLSEEAKNAPGVKKIINSQVKSRDIRNLCEELSKLYETNGNPQRILEIKKLLEDYGITSIPQDSTECLKLAENEDKNIENDSKDLKHIILAEKIDKRKSNGEKLTPDELKAEKILKATHPNWYNKQGSIDYNKLGEENGKKNNAKEIAEEQLESLSIKYAIVEKIAETLSKVKYSEKDDFDESKITNYINSEIKKIPSELTKLGFTKEQIKAPLDKYIDTLKNFEIDDIKNFKELDEETRKEQLENLFIKNDTHEKMAEMSSKVGDLEKEDNNESKKAKTKNSIKNEIKQLPNALAKANFSQEEIKENLNTYINFLNRIDNNEIEELSTWKQDRLSQFFNKKLIKFGMNEQMAEILSKVNFNGQLFNILGNEEQKKEFFEQFDKAINQNQQKDETMQLDGELGEIFGQYFQDNAEEINVSAIEEQKKQTAKAPEKFEPSNDTKSPTGYVDVELNSEQVDKVMDMVLKDLYGKARQNIGEYLKLQNEMYEEAKKHFSDEEPTQEQLNKYIAEREYNKSQQRQVYMMGENGEKIIVGTRYSIPIQETAKTTETPSEQPTPENTTSNLETKSEEETQVEDIAQETALEVQDNSFIGKIKRVIANMRDSKNKDNSKGFFARLKDSVQNVFGNKKSEYYTEQEDTVSSNSTTGKNPKDLSFNERYAVEQTQLNQNNPVKAKQTPTKKLETETTKEDDDLVQ